VWLTGAGVGAGLLLAFVLAHGVANLIYGVRSLKESIRAALGTH